MQNADGTFLNAGTDSPSWFTLDAARAKAEAYEHAASLIRERFAPDAQEFTPEPPADGLPL